MLFMLLDVDRYYKLISVSLNYSSKTIVRSATGTCITQVLEVTIQARTATVESFVGKTKTDVVRVNSQYV